MGMRSIFSWEFTGKLPRMNIEENIGEKHLLLLHWICNFLLWNLMGNFIFQAHSNFKLQLVGNVIRIHNLIFPNILILTQIHKAEHQLSHIYQTCSIPDKRSRIIGSIDPLFFADYCYYIIINRQYGIIYTC